MSLCNSQKDLEYEMDRFYCIYNKFNVECIPTARVEKSNEYAQTTPELFILKISFFET